MHAKTGFFAFFAPRNEKSPSVPAAIDIYSSRAIEWRNARQNPLQTVEVTGKKLQKTYLFQSAVER